MVKRWLKSQRRHTLKYGGSSILLLLGNNNICATYGFFIFYKICFFLFCVHCFHMTQ
jgi:hypothetical protein